MQFRLGDWIGHPHFGHGQIVEDNDTYFVIRFITQGEKKITKDFQIAAGNPPHPGFSFPNPKSIKRPRSKDMAEEPRCFTCENVFPFIQEVIESLCEEFGKAEHDAIVDKLMRHPEASGMIELAVVRCPHFTKRWIASNMVQWMSQHYTQGHADADVFVNQFQRKRDSTDNWIYSLRKTEDSIGSVRPLQGETIRYPFNVETEAVSSTSAFIPSAPSGSPAGLNGWTREKLRQLRRIVADNPASAANAMMAMTCANPGQRVSFQAVSRHSGRTINQSKSDLARFTFLIRKTFGRDQHWPVEWANEQDGFFYWTTPQIAAWWNEK